jgi:hypothetical protein
MINLINYNMSFYNKKAFVWKSVMKGILILHKILNVTFVKILLIILKKTHPNVTIAP